VTKRRRRNVRTRTISQKQVRYQIEVRHPDLGKLKMVSGYDPDTVKQQAQALADKWDAEAERKKEAERKRVERETRAQRIEENKQKATAQTEQAQAALEELDHLLDRAVNNRVSPDWESFKDRSKYRVERPSLTSAPIPVPPEPQQTDAKYQVRDSLLNWLSQKRREADQRLVEESFRKDHADWESQVEQRAAQLAQYQARVKAWETDRDRFLSRQSHKNAAIDQLHTAYLEKHDPEAVAKYVDLVLSQSVYPSYFPRSFDVQYNQDNGMLVVDYELPARDALPTTREVRYIQSRDAFEEKTISRAELNRRYDDVLYQVALGTLHELFVTDETDALTAVVFNGYVETIDPATGRRIRPYVMSLQASKEHFQKIRLANVEPKACFQNLKGVAAARLSNLTPIRPLLRISREDARFVEGQAVANFLDDRSNLAAMHWEDFEHLIRELFESEFAGEGSEVKVTRASRDGGVDAVIFDPDKIHGGKIVIQAKRYTNTVGVSFVRDLYGTMLNEGANKGILVTTSDYGSDAYEFAKDKPLVLLNGGELLYLLEKHGHKAMIDIDEAKRLLAEE
jgi:restriction system protein